MSRFWRLLETGLRFCAHTGGVQDKNAVAVLGSCGSGWDRVVLGWIVQCSWISWISPAPLAIFNKLCEILDYWIYEIYVDLLIAE